MEWSKDDRVLDGGVSSKELKIAKHHVALGDTLCGEVEQHD